MCMEAVCNMRKQLSYLFESIVCHIEINYTKLVFKNILGKTLKISEIIAGFTTTSQ